MINRFHLLVIFAPSIVVALTFEGPLCFAKDSVAKDSVAKDSVAKDSVESKNAEPTRVDFNRDIRPILSDNCYYCHGFDEQNRKAGLRLDTFEGATGDLGSYQAITPGDADASELIIRILSDDPDTVMPPPETEQQISAAERDLLMRWINQGAEFERHWAWTPLERPETLLLNTDVDSFESKAAAVDAFLERGWIENDAVAVSDASPRERLRRLSLDLRGLLPTAEDVEEFVADPSDATYFAVRDRWMSELSYAEHQAVRWLDLVRWADTSGFVSDEPIASGAYRAWIIQAIRANQPFDQFSIEQLAGDLLDDPTDDQLIASGYNRIVNTNCEAGAIETEQLYKLKGEHVRAFGTVWMGMTTGCAECHDHKFDPILAEDYYSLGAFFDDLLEAGVYTPGDRREPLHYVYPSGQEKSARDRVLVSEIAALRQEISAKSESGLEEWLTAISKRSKDSQSRSDFVWVPGQLPAARVIEGQFETDIRDEKHVRITKAAPGQLRRHHAGELITGFFSPNGQKTDGAKDAWFVDVWIDPDDKPELIGFQVSNGSYGRIGWQTPSYETYFWGDDQSGQLDKPRVWSAADRTKRIGDMPSETGWVRLRVPLNETIKAVGGKTFDAAGMAWLHCGGHIQWGDSGLELRTDKATKLRLAETGVRKWWEQPKNRQVYQSRANYPATALAKKAEQRDSLQNEILVDAYRENTQPVLRQRLRECESELGMLRSEAMPVLVSRKAEQRKTTRILNRGDYQDTTGRVVSPSFPQFLSKETAPDETTLTRLDLANWLFDGGSRLTARVYVNRLWHQFFGRGLSETLEDSGTQGDWPSHPELLDWLAAEFRDSGWNRNHMVRLLTSTKAYQLSSIPSGDLQQRDPSNRWHARQGRFRNTAEIIRDTTLQAAGLLHNTSSVPVASFFPYQPEPYWTRSDKVMYGSRHMIWETSQSTQQYSRSLYSFWKRQNIHPTMLAFDAPTRQECTAKRNITNTPGQALALLNDPIFVEAARVLAIKLCKNPGSTDERLNEAFRLTLQRQSTPQERAILSNLLNSQQAHYQAHRDLAEELVSIGQAETPDDQDAIEVAAWTAVTRALFNLHEFLNRS